MATIRTAKKLLLGREIAHMLEAAGISQAEAASLIETSQSRIAGLIGGAGNIAPGDLEILATRLGFDDEGYRATLRELRRDNHKRGFWSTGHNRAYAEDLRLLVGLEKHADHIRSAQAEVIPGLLQCEAYVRAQHAELPSINGLTIDDLVEARLIRQEILDKDGPPAAHFVLSESCVRRMWGTADVMREAVDHLIGLSERPNVMIQVLPFDAPPGRRYPVGDRFTLLRVPSPGVAGPLELAYIETVGEIRYLDDKASLAAHDTAWARLTSAALSYADSRKFLKRVAHDFAR